MVSMARSHLSSTPVYITKTIDARRLGPTQHGGKMPSPTITAHVASKSGSGNRDSQLASILGTEGATPQPPHHIARKPVQLDYLRQYVRDMAYIEPPNRTEATRTFKKRIYMRMILMAAAGKTPPLIRVVHKQPDINWNQVWQNLHESRTPKEVLSAWYAVIHDLLPTRERLAAINLAVTANCRQCNAKDSLSHRLTECGEGPAIWSWTNSKIAMMLRIDRSTCPLVGPCTQTSTSGHHRDDERYNGH
jgi:hypothetical protein